MLPRVVGSKHSLALEKPEPQRVSETKSPQRQVRGLGESREWAGGLRGRLVSPSLFCPLSEDVNTKPSFCNIPELFLEISIFFSFLVTLSQRPNS